MGVMGRLVQLEADMRELKALLKKNKGSALNKTGMGGVLPKEVAGGAEGSGAVTVELAGDNQGHPLVKDAPKVPFDVTLTGDKLDCSSPK